MGNSGLRADEESERDRFIRRAEDKKQWERWIRYTLRPHLLARNQRGRKTPEIFCKLAYDKRTGQWHICLYALSEEVPEEIVNIARELAKNVLLPHVVHTECLNF